MRTCMIACRPDRGAERARPRLAPLPRPVAPQAQQRKKGILDFSGFAFPADQQVR